MTVNITDVVRQFKRDWTSGLEPTAIADACRDAGHVWRERVLTPVVTLQLFFVQILYGNTACSHLRHLTKLPATAEAYCQARMKLPLAVFQILLRAVSQRLHQQTLDDGRWLGHRTFFADGSSFSMPDTPVLQSCFGQPGQQQSGCGFPVALFWPRSMSPDPIDATSAGREPPTKSALRSWLLVACALLDAEIYGATFWSARG